MNVLSHFWSDIQKKGDKMQSSISGNDGISKVMNFHAPISDIKDDMF